MIKSRDESSTFITALLNVCIIIVYMQFLNIITFAEQYSVYEQTVGVYTVECQVRFIYYKVISCKTILIIKR